jgi:anti-sigma factor RsiW
MNCRSAESLFSALIEDELSQKERRFLEAHLLSCRKCSAGLKETRAAMELVRHLPVEETSPHFEEDVMARVRSGEGLRPSLVEWARGLLAPAWLRPAAVAGAGACAVWVAAFFMGQFQPSGNGAAPTASVVTPPPPAAVAPAPGALETPSASVAVGPSPASESRIEVADRPVAPPRRTAPAVEPVASEPSGLAASPREMPFEGFTDAGDVPIAGSGYVDEYITDQFYLERGNGGSGNPSVTPVSGRPSDDVYIIF